MGEITSWCEQKGALELQIPGLRFRFDQRIFLYVFLVLPSNLEVSQDCAFKGGISYCRMDIEDAPLKMMDDLDL